tara:strand:- start:943 stop:1110 length:168 start_codon:yes stop_codon:yes gene_type:complete
MKMAKSVYRSDAFIARGVVHFDVMPLNTARIHNLNYEWDRRFGVEVALEVLKADV